MARCSGDTFARSTWSVGVVISEELRIIRRCSHHSIAGWGRHRCETSKQDGNATDFVLFECTARRDMHG